MVPYHKELYYYLTRFIMKCRRLTSEGVNPQLLALLHGIFHFPLLDALDAEVLELHRRNLLRDVRSDRAHAVVAFISPPHQLVGMRPTNMNIL